MKKKVLIFPLILLLCACQTNQSSVTSSNSNEASEQESSSIKEDVSSEEKVSQSEIKYDELQPIAYCSFDNLDANGNYYDLITGEPFYKIGDVTQVEGKVNKAAYFDGDSSLALTTPNNLKGNAKHTIMAHVTVDMEKLTSTSEHVIGGFGEFRHLSDTRLMIWHNMYTVTSYDVCTFASIPSDSKTNYHHLTMTYDGSQYKMFIDGIYMVSVTAPQGINIQDSPLYVGGFANNILNWVGTIDELYVFDKELSMDEIYRYKDNEAVVKMKEATNNKPSYNGVEDFDSETSTLEKGKWNEFQYIHGKTILPFKVYVPANYSSDRKSPLMLFLHGDGTNGKTVDDVIYGGEAVSVRKAMVEHPECMIVVPVAGAPWVNVPNDLNVVYPYHTYSINDVTPSKYFNALDSLMNEIENNYYIDKSRIYFSGYSRGTMAGWYLMNKYVGKYAAALLCCGAAPFDVANNLKNTPIWYFHGDKDDLVDINDMSKVIDDIRTAGGDVIYSICPGYGHGLEAALLQQSDLISWLFSKKRGN